MRDTGVSSQSADEDAQFEARKKYNIPHGTKFGKKYWYNYHLFHLLLIITCITFALIIRTKKVGQEETSEMALSCVYRYFHFENNSIANDYQSGNIHVKHIVCFK